MLSTITLCGGCSTGAYSTNGYDYSISDIQKSLADNLPEGLGATNTNRRVFYSRRFTVNQEKKKRIPLVMRVIIESDRRPYGLTFEVRKVSPNTDNLIDAFNDGDSFAGQDSLAKRVVTRVEDQLAQRRKNKNLFDDFKPF